MNATLAGPGAVVRALDAAHTIRFGAYVLGDGPVRRALEGAADRGADVAVTLAGEPFAGTAAATAGRHEAQAARADLEAHGVRVRIGTEAAASAHIKGAVIDGVAYLDDRNWPADGADLVLRSDDPAAVATVAAAIDGTSRTDGVLPTDKAAALRGEAAAIAAGSGACVDVESESFGRSVVSKTLDERLAHGARVRLLVTARELGRPGSTERASLDRLAAAGATVRVCANAEKLCVAGDRAWVGSANATAPFPPALDWGYATTDPALVRGIAAAFERNWNAGRAYAGPGTSSAA